jgi:exodeoxyribonuclease VII large subunit
MQGAETVPSIIRALDRIFQYEDFFDVVVIIRGGGATADLGSFDNYDLAFYITQFPLPVITGIGHEKDDTIVDLVAHTRLKTPTAVAEFFINGMERFYDRLQELENEIVQQIRNKVDFQQNRLERISTSLSRSVSGFINEKQVELTKKGNELQQNFNRFSFLKKYELNNVKHKLDTAVSIWFVETKNKIFQKKGMLKRVTDQTIQRKQSYLDHLRNVLISESKQMIFREKEKVHLNENTVRLLDPENILKRGYSLTFKEGKIIKSAKQLFPDDKIETRFADGNVQSIIIKKDNNDN